MNSDLWNDQRITAYVFGELTDSERAAFEAELSRNQELAAAVDEARSLTGSLSEMFATEQTPRLDPQRRDQIAAYASNSVLKPASTGAATHSDSRRWMINLAASVLVVGSVGTFWWLGQRSPDDMSVAMQAPASNVSDSQTSSRVASEVPPAVTSEKAESASLPMDKVAMAPPMAIETSGSPETERLQRRQMPLAKETAPSPLNGPSESESMKSLSDARGEAASQLRDRAATRMLKRAESSASNSLSSEAKSEESQVDDHPYPASSAMAPPAPSPVAPSPISPSPDSAVDELGLGGAMPGQPDLGFDSSGIQPTPGPSGGMMMGGGMMGGRARNASPAGVPNHAPLSGLRSMDLATDGLADASAGAEAMGFSSAISRPSANYDMGPIADGKIIDQDSEQRGGLGGVGPGEGGDQFEPIIENDFRRVSEEPLSTFSIDVDTASFSKSRQYLTQLHTVPPAGAIRIEEWINYFEYNYEPPAIDDKHPFATRVEMSTCPWNPVHRVVSIGIKGKVLDTTSLPASNLVFLIDTSGSMNEPNKLPLVKESLRNLVAELRPQDRVAIVVYAGAAGLVLDSTPASDKSKVLRSINQMQSGGSTNGGQGIQLAYKIARENFIKEGNNRVLLCSDGDFNVGTTSTDELVTMVETESKGGIDLTVLGYGEGNFNDSMLEQISGRGNGNYAFVDSQAEAQRVLVKQLAGTLYTIARDVKIQVDFNPRHVAAYRLIGYENRKLNNEDFKDDTKDAGEIGAGHCVTALYELIPAGTGTQELAPEVETSKYQKTKEPTPAAESNEALTVRLRYKRPGEDQSVALEVPANQNDQAFDSAGRDLRLAATVAGFGMTLRNSKHIGNWTLTNVLAAAEKLAAEKADTSINELVEMIKQARGLVTSEK